MLELGTSDESGDQRIGRKPIPVAARRYKIYFNNIMRRVAVKSPASIL